MTRKIVLFLILSLALIAIAVAVPPQGTGGGAYDALKAEAERYYAEKSFSRAHELYEKALQSKPPADEVRWIEFRLADTTWRADVASPDRDPAKREAARVELERIATLSDRVGAEANESLGDYYSTHPYIRNPHMGQRFYLAALEFWAGSSDLDVARERYLSIVWRLSSDNFWQVPREVLVNATKIAVRNEDKARARFYLAQKIGAEGGAANVERSFELYEEILRLGRTEFYDDALFAYASAVVQWSDMVVRSADRDAVPPADYAKALELFRRLRREFTQTQSHLYDDAVRAIEQLTRVNVQVFAAMTFLPDSDQEIGISWRNTKSVEVTFHEIDLVRDVQRKEREHDWKRWIRLGEQKVARRITHETHTNDYEPGQEAIRLNPRLEPGAYLVTARAANGGESSRELLLVTDAHILVHSAGNKASIHVSDVETGEPIANARVRAWTHKETDLPVDATTDANGLATITVGAQGISFITASGPNGRQAWHQSWVAPYHRGGRGDAPWRIYAFTDRPAYRPNETVKWKMIARVREKDRWITPRGSVSYTITSGRGDKVAEGTAELNAYGSFWSELALTPEMQLGEYHVTFRTGDRWVGQAMLFRLEEYKLPEFVVTVSTPDGTQYRLGDTIEATIDASYYFGGPVANATVEAVVYASPVYRYWYPWREYHWYYSDIRPQYEPDRQISTQTLQTDANGRAILRIETARDAQDTQYRIEARVVDASRREVRGTGNVRVTRQRYTVVAQPEHFVHRPGEPARVAFKAMDANDKPVRTTGTVTVVRRTWKVREYAEEQVLTTKLETDAEGEATLTFTPKTTGYYVIRWESRDGEGNRARDIVTAEATIWVANRDTTELGYFQQNGVELIVDKETMRAGETANVLVVVPSAGRWVLLSSAADTLLDSRVLKMDGTAKLVQIQLDERHVPNFFLTASSVFNIQIATEHERIVVPPVEHFISVDVKSDREQYEPRQEGTLTITTRDADNKPVAAEVAVAVSDEAVTAIQSDPAGDPRQFFFGEQRHNALGVTAGLHTQRYGRLKSVEEEAKEREAKEEGGVAGGAVGRLAGDAIQETSVRAESITVTASAPVAQMAPASAPPPPPAPVAPPAAPEMAKGAAADGYMNQIDVVVRSDFRSTAFWKPDVVTDANGTATVKVQFPEALTTWRATARAATTGAMFGIGSSTARTQLPLLVRLQAPRFFVVGDRTTISAVINNNTNDPMTVTPSLVAEGLSGATGSQPVVVPAHGEARADWTVTADRAGTAKLRVTARSATHGDAMEKTFLVWEHGIDKLIARSGKLRGGEAQVRLDLPRERRATDLTVQIAPSLAVTMLDALPYLIEFPYGCTEQTMSRFLPAAIVARTLERLGLDPKEVSSRAVRRIPSRVAGDFGSSARPGMTELDEVTAAGIKRLYDMQHENGAWGWFEEGPDDDWMTAYVVWGFSIARDAGLRVDAGRIDRAASWLRTQLVETRRQPNEQAWILHALSAWVAKPSPAETKAFDEVYASREKLSAYSRALLALTAHRYGSAERANVLIRNLEDGVKIDRTPDQSVLLKGETAAETMATAHWGSDGFWWRWHEGPIETTAFALQALVTIDPKHRLIEPVMNWLVKNRRGAQWTNTRDTAIALLAMNDYLEQSGELRGDVAYELTVNGRVIATHTVTPAEVLRTPSRFSVDPSFLTDALQDVRIRRTGGTGPIYFSAEARFVSLEEPIKPTGHEMFVQREYFRLRPRPTLLKGVQYDRVPLRDGESIKSGDRVEVVVSVDVKNDYEYLLFEDLKPAGLEAVELQSGQPMWATQEGTGATAFVYQELRDRKVALFADKLQQGIWKMNYSLRAEVPGTFHALPLLGQAMYVPDIRANGEEVRITVTD